MHATYAALYLSSLDSDQSEVDRDDRSISERVDVSRSAHGEYSCGEEEHDGKPDDGNRGKSDPIGQQVSPHEVIVIDN